MAEEGATEAEASKDVACPAGAGVTDREATGAWSGLIATPLGYEPTLTVPVTVLVAVSMTLTMFPSSLVAHASVPSGVTAAPPGPSADRLTVEVTVLVVVSNTNTVLLYWPATPT